MPRIKSTSSDGNLGADALDWQVSKLNEVQAENTYLLDLAPADCSCCSDKAGKYGLRASSMKFEMLEVGRRADSPGTFALIAGDSGVILGVDTLNSGR